MRHTAEYTLYGWICALHTDTHASCAHTLMRMDTHTLRQTLRIHTYALRAHLCVCVYTYALRSARRYATRYAHTSQGRRHGVGCAVTDTRAHVTRGCATRRPRAYRYHAIRHRRHTRAHTRADRHQAYTRHTLHTHIRARRIQTHTRHTRYGCLHTPRAATSRTLMQDTAYTRVHAGRYTLADIHYGYGLHSTGYAARTHTLTRMAGFTLTDHTPSHTHLTLHFIRISPRIARNGWRSALPRGFTARTHTDVTRRMRYADTHTHAHTRHTSTVTTPYVYRRHLPSDLPYVRRIARTLAMMADLHTHTHHTQRAHTHTLAYTASYRQTCATLARTAHTLRHSHTRHLTSPDDTLRMPRRRARSRAADSRASDTLPADAGVALHAGYGCGLPPRIYARHTHTHAYVAGQISHVTAAYRRHTLPGDRVRSSARPSTAQDTFRIRRADQRIQTVRRIHTDTPDRVTARMIRPRRRHAPVPRGYTDLTRRNGCGWNRRAYAMIGSDTLPSHLHTVRVTLPYMRDIHIRLRAISLRIHTRYLQRIVSSLQDTLFTRVSLRASSYASNDTALPRFHAHTELTSRVHRTSYVSGHTHTHTHTSLTAYRVRIRTAHITRDTAQLYQVSRVTDIPLMTIPFAHTASHTAYRVVTDRAGHTPHITR